MQAAGGQLALDSVTVPWGRHADFFVGVAAADGGAELVVAAAGGADGGGLDGARYAHGQ